VVSGWFAWLLLQTRNLFAVTSLANFTTIVPCSSMMFTLASHLTDPIAKLIFIGSVFCCLLPTVYFKLCQAHLLIASCRVVTLKGPNPERIFHSRIWWLKLHIFIEDIAQVTFMTFLFNFQAYKTACLWFGIGYCAILGLVSLAFAQVHSRRVALIKVANYLSLFAFMVLSLHMVKGVYRPNGIALSLALLMVHGSKLANSMITAWLMFNDKKSYQFMLQRQKDFLNESIMSSRLEILSSLNRMGYEINSVFVHPRQKIGRERVGTSGLTSIHFKRGKTFV
jgi:hypothetical protein